MASLGHMPLVKIVLRDHYIAHFPFISLCVINGGHLVDFASLNVLHEVQVIYFLVGYVVIELGFLSSHFLVKVDPLLLATLPFVEETFFRTEQLKNSFLK